MSDIANRCEGLSKQYRIAEEERCKALRDVITDALSSPIRWARTTLDRRPATADGYSNGHRSSVVSRSPNGRPSSVVGQPSADGNGTKPGEACVVSSAV